MDTISEKDTQSADDKKKEKISYIEAIPEWTHNSKATKHPICCHLDTHKDKEITKPSHIITRHLNGKLYVGNIEVNYLRIVSDRSGGYSGKSTLPTKEK